MSFGAKDLRLDAEAEIARIGGWMVEGLRSPLRRRGIVVGLSGGIDSSVTAALAVRALGPERVFGLFMPEDESDPQSLALGRELAEALGISTAVENIGPILAAAGCYSRRDAFIREALPEYGEGWRCKVVLESPFSGRGLAISWLVAVDPDGNEVKKRMPASVYLGMIAAANMKQRTRKQIEYYHADRLNYAVAGTPNRLEYDQGFYVKNGDGAADLKPIAHLYKTQVYQLAEALGVPESIRRRPPTTDTWSLPQTQDEYYFSLPHALMDLCLYALDNERSAQETAAATGLTVQEVEAAWQAIEGKRRVAASLGAPPLTLFRVRAISGKRA
jgi:NAD+ synthase